MNDMEHMKMRWIPLYENGQWNIVTEQDGEPWYVASIPLALPGCKNGERTARAICDEHNSHIANPTGQPPPRLGGGRAGPGCSQENK